MKVRNEWRGKQYKKELLSTIIAIFFETLFLNLYRVYNTAEIINLNFVLLLNVKIP